MFSVLDNNDSKVKELMVPRPCSVPLSHANKYKSIFLTFSVWKFGKKSLVSSLPILLYFMWELRARIIKNQNQIPLNCNTHKWSWITQEVVFGGLIHFISIPFVIFTCFVFVSWTPWSKGLKFYLWMQEIITIILRSSVEVFFV